MTGDFDDAFRGAGNAVYRGPMTEDLMLPFIALMHFVVAIILFTSAL